MGLQVSLQSHSTACTCTSANPVLGDRHGHLHCTVKYVRAFLYSIRCSREQDFLQEEEISLYVPSPFSGAG